MGGLDESRRLSGCEDYDLWLRLAAAGCRFHYVDEILALYRQVLEGASHDLNAQRQRTIWLLEKIPSYAGELPHEEKAAVDDYLSRLHAFLCLAAFCDRKPSTVLSHLIAALHCDPTIAVHATRSILRRI